jgi:Tfp pilus assembly protein PilO
MKISPLYQALAIGGVLFVGVVVLYYEFLLKPVNNRIVQLSGDLDQKKKDLDDAKKTMAKYVEFKKRSDSVQRELEWIQNRIPKAINKSQLLESFNLVQSRSGIFLTGFQMTGAANPRDTYTEIPVNVKFNTDYPGLLNFLYQTSVSPLLMTVNGIVVTSYVDPTGSNLTLSVQAILNGVQTK